MIKEHLARISEEISQVCQKIGKSPQEITLVGVTKFAPSEKIQEAVSAGLKHIAENKVQEADKKFPQFNGVTKHIIGHLQTNKVKAALKLVDLIQSVDSLKLALEIEKEAGKLEKTADILVQVNTAGEEQKSGIPPSQAISLLENIAGCEHIRVLGLMTMAPFTEDQAIIRKTFSDLKKIFDEAARHFKGHDRISMKHLSMGMTSDFKIAIEEGSNMVRIGSAIFKE